MPKSLGIEIGARAIRIAELERGASGYKLTSVCTIPSALFADVDDDGPATDETRAKVAAELGDKLNRCAATGLAVGGGVTGLTGRNLMLRYSRIPQGPEHRMRMMIDFEIQEMTSQGGDDLSSAYTKLNVASGGGESTMLVGLARTDFLEGSYDQLRRLGLKPSSVTVSSIGLFNAFMLTGPTLDIGETVMLASVGYESTEVCLVRDGDCLFARNVNLGGRMFADVLAETRGEANRAQAFRMVLAKADITPPGGGAGAGSPTQAAFWSAGDQLYRALESTGSFAKLQLRQPDFKVDKVFVTGECARIKGLAEFFRSRFSVPVALYNPLAGLDEVALPAAAKQGEGSAQANPYQYALAVGLARMGVERDPFTLPFESKAAARREHFLTRTVFMYAAALLAIALCGALLPMALGFADESRAARATLAERGRRFDPAKQAYERAVAARDAAKPTVEALRAVTYPTAALIAVANTVRDTVAGYATADEDADGGARQRGFDGEIVIRRLTYRGPGADVSLPCELVVECYITRRGGMDEFALRDRFVNDVERHHAGVITGVQKAGPLAGDSDDDVDIDGQLFRLTFRLAITPPASPDPGVTR